MLGMAFGKNSLIEDNEPEYSQLERQPEECDFDEMNWNLKCFWVDNWYLIAAGFIIPMISLYMLNESTGIFESYQKPQKDKD